MLQQIFYVFPELALFGGIIHLYFSYILGEESPKLFARTARIWLLISLFCSVMYYDHSFNEKYFSNNSYTLLFKIIINIFAYMILGLAPQYFSATKKSGCKFYILFLSALISINVMLATVNVTILVLSYLLLLFINHRLLEVNCDKMSLVARLRYMSAGAVILCLLVFGFVGIYTLTNGSPDYYLLANIIEEKKQSFMVYLYVICLIIPFLYSLGLAPFHSFSEDKLGKSSLPVSHYLAVVVPFAYWGTFIKLNKEIATPFAEQISPVYMFLGLLSVVYGAMGANARINLHRIYSFCLMYYFGMLLVLLSLFNPQTDFIIFISLFASIIGINGVYLVFYSLKSRNEYLSAITSLSGLAETRPYTTATLLISLFSLMGMPPLAGFLGQVSLASELIASKSFISLSIIFFFLLLLAKTYLEIMKTAYFEHKIIALDTEPKFLWLYMLGNIICIGVIAFNPNHLLKIIKDMFYVIFI